MSESASPESGPLSREQAVEMLTERPPEAAAPEAPVEAAAEPEEIDAGTSPADEPDVEAENLTEGEPEPELEAETLEPPLYWSPEAKAEFAELPPNLQAVVLAQEGPREAATAKAKAEAAEKVKVADAELAKLGQFAESLADRLPQWISTFESRWGTETPDWVAYAQEHGVEQMTLLKLQHEQEQAQLQQAVQAKQVAEGQAQQAFVRAEYAKLTELAPDLVHPETGQAKRHEVAEYLVKAGGIDLQAVQNISAAEMIIARKAMLYDQAQAALKAKPAPKPPAPALRSPVRPAAAQSQVPTQQREAQRLQNRFAQTANREDAVALILAKGL